MNDSPPGWTRERSTPGIHEFYRHESGAWIWLGGSWYAKTSPSDDAMTLGPFDSREEAMSAALTRALL